MGAIQLNARLDEDLKREGDAVLADYGVSTTEAIRSLWAYMAKSRTLPDFIAAESRQYRPTHESAKEGAGIAIRLMREKGFKLSYPDPVVDMDQHINAMKELNEQAMLEHYGSSKGE